MGMAHDDLEHFDDGKVTVGERVWYFINGLAAVSPQIYLYHSIFGIDFFDTYYLYVIVSLVAAYLMSEAYHNAAYWLRDRLGHARADIVTNNLVAAANAGKKNAAKSRMLRKDKESKLTANPPLSPLCTTTSSSCSSSCSSDSISSLTSLLLSDTLSP